MLLQLTKTEQSAVEFSPQDWSNHLHAIFKHPRKQIGKTLPNINFEKLGINPQKRAQELSTDNLITIATQLTA